ncbi:hypothetical protein ACIO3O_39165 [Streptomyces sp. NPDC087440]|uniref:hypothetical protein n=1 Tax=Streptomyces sp. NPDC087440 TaxID=3365790 RepID=UPI0037F13394
MILRQQNRLPANGRLVVGPRVAAPGNPDRLLRHDGGEDGVRPEPCNTPPPRFDRAHGSQGTQRPVRIAVLDPALGKEAGVLPRPLPHQHVTPIPIPIPSSSAYDRTPRCFRTAVASPWIRRLP